MALFEKFFPTRKKVDKKERNIQDHARPFRFSKEQVRVLLYRECEWRGRRLLYDSAAVEKVVIDSTLKTPQCSFKRFYHPKKENKNEKRQEKKTSADKIVEISEGYGFQCNTPNPDSNILGEMIFGSVAMNYKGMSLKVHILNAPQRLMCTKVFCMPSRGRCRPHGGQTSARTSISSGTGNGSKPGDGCPQENFLYLPNLTSNVSCNISESVASSCSSKIGTSSPEVPLFNIDDHLSGNWSMNKEDSGFYGDFSSHSSVGSSCNYDSICSLWDRDDGIDNTDDLYFFGNPSDACQPSIGSGLQWRLNRHLSTSLEKSLTSSSAYLGTNSSALPGASDSQFGSGSAASTASESLTGSAGAYSNSRKTKMGLAIIITLTESVESHMLRFLMEHAMLVEGALGRLRLAVRSACKDPHSFISNMTAATHDAAQWLVDLLTGPRLAAPLWLTLAGSQKSNITDKMADIFLQDFCSLLKTMDTKDTYFFMSTLITSVLTHHLGWVSCVSPYTTLSTLQQKDLDSLNRSHPYNPLWAQLGELYGAVGTPAKISRTVVFGRQNSALIKRILTVLSYFIRCGEVKRFSVDSSPVNFESIGAWMENYKTESSLLTLTPDRAKCSSPDCGDYIEMSTFSIKQKDDAISPDFPISDLKYEFPLNYKTKTTDSVPEATFGINVDNNKSNSLLKRTTSCAFKLHDSANKHFDFMLNSSESSLNSASTLKSTENENDDSTNTLIFNNIFNSSNGNISSDSIDINEIQTKVKKLCRVPTNSILHHMESAASINNDPLISSYDDSSILKFEINSVSNSKIECEKQQNSSDNLTTTFNGINGSIKNKPQLKNVIFVLGEDEALVNLKTKYSNKHLPKPMSDHQDPIATIQEESLPSTSPPLAMNSIESRFSVDLKNTPLGAVESAVLESLGDNSLQPSPCCIEKPQCKHSKLKKHSGVKFEFDKYPQIVTKYMKSKNLEILDRHVIGKPGNLKMDGFEFELGTSIVTVKDDCDTCISCTFNAQSLQTPSNASELEYTGDMPGQGEIQYAKEKLVSPSTVEPVQSRIELSPKIYVRRKLPKTLIMNNNVEKPPKLLEPRNNYRRDSTEAPITNLGKICPDNEVIELPMAITTLSTEDENIPPPGYASSLLGDVTDHYIPDMVLQGTVSSSRDWEWKVKRDIALQGRNAPGGAACLLADIDDWSVGVWSSGGGSACGMSALVASMLESLPHMCNAKLPATDCLAFIESKLRELCIRSKTLSELLLETDFCDMDYLTKTLRLDPNDVPLLLAIASTHSPQVALKYGVSFR